MFPLTVFSDHHPPGTFALHCAGAGQWADKYIYDVVSLAGPMLGVPKGVSSVLSGEMKDTADMPAAFTLLRERFLSRSTTREMLRSFLSGGSLLPVGTCKCFTDNRNKLTDAWYVSCCPCPVPLPAQRQAAIESGGPLSESTPPLDQRVTPTTKPQQPPPLTPLSAQRVSPQPQAQDNTK